MTDDVCIERASIADVPQILRFIRELAVYERLADEVVATEEKLRATLFGPDPAAEVILAYAGSEPVGFALYFLTYSTFLAQRGLYLEDLFVRPEWRGRGVGRGLLEHLGALAVERGCGRFEWAVLDWNMSAIRFYEQLGARPVAGWTRYRLTGEALRRFGASRDAPEAAAPEAASGMK
jgi:GNAT superfamily N-acetyltransferase